ncbi:MAG TPA: hypothetical protein GXX30_04295 [Firmicutes bacterium]|nr:hypothetical protein [Candidatus Fermentithermobacillaceae bacterium]
MKRSLYGWLLVLGEIFAVFALGVLFALQRRGQPLGQNYPPFGSKLMFLGLVTVLGLIERIVSKGSGPRGG